MRMIINFIAEAKNNCLSSDNNTLYSHSNFFKGIQNISQTSSH